MTNIQNSFSQPIGFSLTEWSGSLCPSRSQMQGRYCRLEPLVPEVHAKALYQAFTEVDDHSNWTYLPYGPFQSFDEFLTWMNAECVHDDPLFYAIIDSATDTPVGIASYLRINPSVGLIEVGHIHYSPKIQRTPIGTEAMFLMMSQAFDELGYRRYEWKCDSLNERSRKAALRLGFSFEGIFRQMTIYKGRNRDTAWFSIINQEWPQLKQAYQKWLNPGNFNEQGQQRKALAEFKKSKFLY